MTLTGFYAVVGASAAIGLGWLAGQARRRRRDRRSDVRITAMTALAALWVLSLPFGVAAAGDLALPGLDELAAQTVQLVLRMVAAYALVVFMIYTSGPSPSRQRHALWQLVPLLAMTTLAAAAAAAIPAALRPAVAGFVLDPHLQGLSSVGIYYSSANLYYAYAFAVAVLWAHRHRRGSTGSLRRGLGIAEAGLVAIVAATAVLLTANISQWLGRAAVPAGGLVAALWLLALGLAVFLTGLLYPAVRMRLAALTVWRARRAALLRLRPLWGLLHDAFPELALDPAPARWVDRHALRAVAHRHRRAVVECRDGLVRLSAYLPADPAGSARVDGDAALVREALAAHQRGDPASPRTGYVLAAPDGEDFEADQARLVVLADALATPAQRGGGPAARPDEDRSARLSR